MRHAKSDAEKKAAGTFRAHEFTDAHRLNAALDRVVRPFPRLLEVPEPTMPLRASGKAEYDKWCRRLREVGMLTFSTVDIVERMAMAKDAIQESYDKGKTPSAKHLEILRGAQLELKALNVDQTLVPEDPNRPNKFEANGFPGRHPPAGHPNRG